MLISIHADKAELGEAAAEEGAAAIKDAIARAGKASIIFATGSSQFEMLDALVRKEIDWLDSEILRLVKRRAEVSQTIGRVRMAAGGPRIVYNREMDVLARYRELGPEGRQLAMALLNLGRGRLGR